MRHFALAQFPFEKFPVCQAPMARSDGHRLELKRRVMTH